MPKGGIIMKKNKVINVIKYIIITILSIILIINIFLIIQSKVHKNKVPSIFGYKAFIVLSDSMETEISQGDLVITKNVEGKDLKENDIIAFRHTDEYAVTHRIINVIETEDDVCFETKGDNNNTKDLNQICSSKIEGKYIKKIPKLGSVLLFFQQPYGIAILILILILVLLLAYVTTNEKQKISKKEYEEFKKYKKKQNKQSKQNKKN